MEPFNKLSDREKVYQKANRLATLDAYHKNLNHDNNWWVVLGNMSEEELEFLPTNWVKKWHNITL